MKERRRSLVVTDGATLNPGDLDWQRFETFGEVIVYDRTPADLVAERCKDAHVIITNKTPINSRTIFSCPRLEFIAVTATGYNIVDLEAAKEKKVKVCNVPGYGTDSVAQHTFALILELTNHVGRNSKLVHDGAWSAAKDWCFTSSPIIELRDKVIGIVGYGRNGQKVAEIASAFKMKVLYHNRSPKDGIGKSVSLDKLFTSSDFISLHLPLTVSNHNFVNADLLARMKPSAFLINTSRGQLINEHDLSNALRKGQIAGAGLDVLSIEPPPADHPLLGVNNCIITAHNAWLSFEARQRIMNITFKNIEKALDGKPQNLVSLKP